MQIFNTHSKFGEQPIYRTTSKTCNSDSAFADSVHVYKFRLLTYLLTYYQPSYEYVTNSIKNRNVTELFSAFQAIMYKITVGHKEKTTVQKVTLNSVCSLETEFASVVATSRWDSLVINASIPESTCRMSLINVSMRCCAVNNLSLLICDRFATSSNDDVSSANSTHSFSRNSPLPAVSINTCDIR